MFTVLDNPPSRPSIKKGEDYYIKTISWVRVRTSFALLKWALTRLRGSRARKIMYYTKNIDFSIENRRDCYLSNILDCTYIKVF